MCCSNSKLSRQKQLCALLCSPVSPQQACKAKTALYIVECIAIQQAAGMLTAHISPWHSMSCKSLMPMLPLPSTSKASKAFWTQLCHSWLCSTSRQSTMAATQLSYLGNSERVKTQQHHYTCLWRPEKYMNISSVCEKISEFQHLQKCMAVVFMSAQGGMLVGSRSQLNMY